MTERTASAGIASLFSTARTDFSEGPLEILLSLPAKLPVGSETLFGTRFPAFLEDAAGFPGPPLLDIRIDGPVPGALLDDVVARAWERRLPVVLTALAGARVETIPRPLLASGRLRLVVVSLDSPDAPENDGLLGAGATARTEAFLAACAAASLPFGARTRIRRETLTRLGLIVERLERLGAALWQPVFPTSPNGDAPEPWLPPSEFEDLFDFLYGVMGSALLVRPCYAPAFRKHFAERAYRERERSEPPREVRTGGVPVPLPELVDLTEVKSELIARQPPGTPPRIARMMSRCGVVEGDGTVYVSSTGDVFPDPELREFLGSVLHTPLSRIYRENPLLKSLRDRSGLQGKCGRCEFSRLCGGSRTRAFLARKNFLAEDAHCTYVPRRGRY